MITIYLVSIWSRMKNKTVSMLSGSSPVISAGKWSKMAVLLKLPTPPLLARQKMIFVKDQSPKCNVVMIPTDKEINFENAC